MGVNARASNFAPTNYTGTPGSEVLLGREFATLDCTEWRAPTPDWQDLFGLSIVTTYRQPANRLRYVPNCPTSQRDFPICLHGLCHCHLTSNVTFRSVPNGIWVKAGLSVEAWTSKQDERLLLESLLSPPSAPTIRDAFDSPSRTHPIDADLDLRLAWEWLGDCNHPRGASGMEFCDRPPGTSANRGLKTGFLLNAFRFRRYGNTSTLSFSGLDWLLCSPVSPCFQTR